MRFSRLLFHCLIIGLTGLHSSCDILGEGPCLEGKGSTKIENREASSFSGIDLRLPGIVYVSSGPAFKIRVESMNNLLPEIETEVENKTLVIKSEKCLEYSQESTRFYVTMPLVENVEVKSSGEVRLVSLLSSQPLRLNLSGSGKISYTGETSKIIVFHSGSGEVELTGTVGLLETTLSGSGKVSGFGMIADTAKTTLTGSGSQQVWVNSLLDANLTGSGNLYYRGKPTIKLYRSGSGDILDGNL